MQYETTGKAVNKGVNSPETDSCDKEIEYFESLLNYEKSYSDEVAFKETTLEIEESYVD